VTGQDRCTVRTADGTLLDLAAHPGPDGRPDGCDPAVHASALYAWLTAGNGLPAPAVELTVRTGAEVHRVSVRRASG
jgi:hypothetical protein